MEGKSTSRKQRLLYRNLTVRKEEPKWSVKLGGKTWRERKTVVCVRSSPPAFCSCFPSPQPESTNQWVLHRNYVPPAICSFRKETTPPGALTTHLPEAAPGNCHCHAAYFTWKFELTPLSCAWLPGSVENMQKEVPVCLSFVEQSIGNKTRKLCRGSCCPKNKAISSPERPMRPGNSDRALRPEKPLVLRKRLAADAPGGNSGHGNKLRHHDTGEQGPRE